MDEFVEKYICELRNAFWCVCSLIDHEIMGNDCAKAGPHHWYSLNKMDTIVDFLQMIFKIIIQNLQTSNAASQNNKQKQHQKKFRIFEQGKSSWMLRFSQNENT